MKHKYDLSTIILSAFSARGTLFPGMFIPWLDRTGKAYPADSYNIDPAATAPKLYTDKGSPLRVEDYATGNYYFMPVYLDKMELTNAVISMSQPKIIVKTGMVAMDGSVKELIGFDDWKIEITVALVGETPNDYPEKHIEKLRDIWRKKEAVEIISALTDIFLPTGCKVILEDLRIDPVLEFEDTQTMSLTLTSDANFELEIE